MIGIVLTQIIWFFIFMAGIGRYQFYNAAFL